MESSQFKKFISKISGQKHDYNLVELNNFFKKTARLEIQTNNNQNLYKTIIWYEFRGWNLSHCTTFKTSVILKGLKGLTKD